MTEKIIAGILFAIALAAFVLSGRSFLGKGFLLNNAYIYASGKERETMDKKPYYRQTGIVLALIGLIFLLNGVSVLVKADWISWLVGGVMAIAVIYAIGSTVAIEKRKKQK